MEIGVVEDDPTRLAWMRDWLHSGQHTVRSFAAADWSPEAAGQASAQDALGIWLIDWELAHRRAGAIVARIRERSGWSKPILVVSDFGDEATVVAALSAGADDCVHRHVKPRELLARINAHGRRLDWASGGHDRRSGGGHSSGDRRAVARSPSGFDAGTHPYTVDVERHALALNGQAIALTQKEFDLAAYFFASGGRVLSRDHLLNRIWGIHAEVDTRTVDTHVSRLRRKLQLSGQFGWKLTSVYATGYRLDNLPAASPVEPIRFLP